MKKKWTNQAKMVFGTSTYHALMMLVSMFFLLHEITYAQSPEWEWAHGVGGMGPDNSARIVTEIDNGTHYTIGNISTTVDFDPGPAVYNVIGPASFICKWDCDGGLVWVKTIYGEASYLYFNRIALDTSGRGGVYVTGYFTGTYDFDPGPSIFNLTSTGIENIFVLKLEFSGEWVWAKSMNGTSFFHEGEIAIAPTEGGDVYITGRFEGTIDFDPGPSIINLTSTSEHYDIFLLKLDSRGDFQWVKSIGGEGRAVGDAFGLALSRGLNTNVYITGYFEGTVDFDPGPGVYSITAPGGGKMYCVTLDSEGNFLWAKAILGVGGSVGHSIAVDFGETGELYYTGYFSGTVDFDPGPATFNLTSLGEDTFILKLDSSGNFLWAKSIGGEGQEYSSTIVSTPAGNGGIYLAGVFDGTTDLDPGPGNYQIVAEGQYDGFLAKYDHLGNFLWAKQIGSPGYDALEGIAIDICDHVFVTGSFADPVLTMDALDVNNTEPNTVESFHMFMALLNHSEDMAMSSGVPDSICQLAPLITLPDVQNCATGSWSGNGVTNNTFNPSGLVGNTFLVFTPHTNACANPVEASIYVSPPTVLSITNVSDTLCESDSPIHLPNIYSGLSGTWSGDGITNNTFNPSGLNGSIPVTFNIDGGLCVSPVSVNIYVNVLEVDAGDDQFIEFGDDAMLIGEAMSQVVMWSWSPADFLSCVDCPDPTVIRPKRDMTFIVEVTDGNGCTASDFVTVFVHPKVFIPTAFSPNGDGINDVVLVYATTGVSNIRSLRFYSRWGEIVSEHSNFSPNDPGYGWDGIYNGQMLNPGVYAWVAEVELDNGKVELLSGGVTLIR